MTPTEDLEERRHRDRRRAATYPGVNPTGWYLLFHSNEIEPGEVRALRVLGEDLAVFRTRGGRVHALASQCPHLGASLAVGSSVVDDCVECAFHGWRFGGDGAVRHVPYLDRPPRAQVRSWPVREIYGLILLWHGPVGTDGEVPYTPDLWPEIDTDRFVARGRHAPRDIRMHLLEFAENSVDQQHFGRLHTEMRLPWTRLRVPRVEVHHVARWETDPERPHVSHFYDDAHLAVLGRHLPSTGAQVHANLVGPASFVMFRLTLQKLGDVLICQTHTPIGNPDDPLRMRVRFTWWSERGVPSVVAWYVVGNWVSQWWQDVEVWENKVHLPRPLLVRGDGAVHMLRRWFAQFYPDRSWDPGGAPAALPSDGA